MILSHQHDFIFFAIPKTGTHAIRIALRKHLGDRDEEQVGLFRKSLLSNPKLREIKHGHITSLQAAEALEPQVWQHYFKFAFVRNPYARLISYAHFFLSQSVMMQKHPLLHLKRLLLFPEGNKRVWFMPQHNFLVDNGGKLIVDYVGKQEHLQEDYAEVCAKLNLPVEELEIVNSSAHKCYQEYYDEELADMVYHYYKQDFITFGYQRDSWKIS